MKHILLPVLAFTMLFAGCSKAVEDQDPSDLATRSVGALLPIEFGSERLSFASMADLESTVADLTALSYEDRQAWLDGQAGFVSMEGAASQINDQMRVSPNLDNVLALREAYADVFLFDPSTVVPVNAAPYYKVSKSGYEWVCNAYGDVEVAGQVVNLNDITSYAQTWRGKIESANNLTKSPETRALNTLTLSGYGRISYITMSYKIDLLKVTPIMKFESRSIINSEWTVPVQDLFTVSYLPGRTNINSLEGYYNIFSFIKYEGKSGTITTSNGNITDIQVGYVYSTYIESTSYTIYSDNTRQSGSITIAY